MKKFMFLLLLLALLGTLYEVNQYIDAMTPEWQAYAIQDQHNQLAEAAQRRHDLTVALNLLYYAILLILLSIVAGGAWVVYDKRREVNRRIKDGHFPLQELRSNGQRWLFDPNKSVFGVFGIHEQTGQLTGDSHLIGPDRQLHYAGQVQQTRSIDALPAFGMRAMPGAFWARLLSGRYSQEPKLIQSVEEQGTPLALTENTSPKPAGDFWSLYSAGALPEQGFLMGYRLEDGQPIQATWNALYSTLLGGASGSGKSTLVRLILSQSALQRGRFIVLDPHYGAGDDSLGQSILPLRNLMLCDIASDDASMGHALNIIGAMVTRRLKGREQDRTPIILVTDETTALLARSNVATHLLDTLALIAQEARKVSVYALCIGQNFSSDVISTTVRNSFASIITCHARRDVARVMSGNPDFGRIAPTLTLGQAAWLTPQGETIRLAFPNTTQAHLAQVARQLPMLTAKPVAPALSTALSNDAEECTPLQRAAAKTPAQAPKTRLVTEAPTQPTLPAPTGTFPASTPALEGKPTTEVTQAQSATPVDAKTLAIIHAFLDGQSLPDIVRTNYNNPTGRAYQAAHAEVQELLRQYIKHRQ